jgi:hypothetical protein
LNQLALWYGNARFDLLSYILSESSDNQLLKV